MMRIPSTHGDRPATAFKRECGQGSRPLGRRPITADALVARADAAMYESKRQGLGRPVVYSADLARTSQVA